MLNQDVIKKIEDFVSVKPRSIQEVANHIGKNWRTADRYIKDIEKDFGTISTRTFREGTRGALKIVYWAGMEKAASSVFQKELEEKIMTGKEKYDFSAFDIFQYVDDKNKSAWVRKGEDEVKLGRLTDFSKLLVKAKKQILFFSGNLSFVNYKTKDVDIFTILDDLVKKGISLKVVCKVDVTGSENVKKLLSLNYKYGKELVEIHHREQPLRATIIDQDLCNLKEVKEPTGREKELKNKTFMFYNLNDKDWTSWMTRIFWKMFSSSIDAKKRLEQMNKLKYVD